MKRILLAAALLASAGAAQAAMMPDELSKKIGQQYGVTVLRLSPGEMDGKKVFFARVMAKGGNSNGAFEVTTFAVDPDSGQLLRSFRHVTSGYELSDAQLTETNRNSWGVPQSGRTWR